MFAITLWDKKGLDLPRHSRGDRMNHFEGHFKGVRDADSYYQAWLPETDVKAVLLIVHGLGEHCGRYMNIVNHFLPLGYAVYGFDLIGHGRSEGRREVVERFTDYTDTLTVYFEMVKGLQAGKPIFLLGHSMGSLIAATYLLDHSADFKGAVISAPLVKDGSIDKTIKIYKGLYHEVFNEPEREQVLKDVQAWLAERTT